MLLLDGYVRVSKVGARTSEEGFISPEVQEAAIRTWAERSGARIVMQPHELNVSGGTMNRPVFNEIMDRIRSGKSGGVVVYRCDRFARTLLGALETLAEIGEHGGEFASATEPTLDYSSPAGRAFMQQMFVFAEFLRSTLKESWAEGNRWKVEREGIHISPTIAPGYDKGPDKRLVPNRWAPVVAEVFQRRGAGETWAALADWLNELGLPKPKRKNAATGSQWTGEAVQRLCRKRVYRGEASRYVDQDLDGRGPVVNGEAHPALVTEEEWQAAQMNPRIAKGGRNGKAAPLLSELIRCQGCRYSLSLGRGPKGERLYRCRAKHASGSCSSPASVMAEAIEAYVEEAVLSEIDGFVKLVPDSGERERASEGVARARADLDDFRRDRAARRKLGPEWHEWLDTYLGAVHEADADLERLNLRAGMGGEGLTRDHFLALPSDDRREVLAGFIDCVFVRRSRGRGRNVDPLDERTRILWRGQGPADLPRRRVANAIVPFDFDDGVEAGMSAAKNST
jgi:DNA invertase Pin-like site-specific DNA recombinase